MAKTTQPAVIEKTQEPDGEKTVPQIKSVLLAPEPTAQTAASGEDVYDAEVSSKTTEAQEHDITTGTTAEATLQAGTTVEQKTTPETAVKAPVQQDGASKTTQEKLPQRVLSKEPAAPLKENTVSRIPAPQPDASAAHSARVVLPPLPAARPVLKKEEPKDAARETLVRAYRVAAGDTLPLLAERYYGDKSEWVRIYEANKDRIEKGSLQKGQILLIP